MAVQPGAIGVVPAEPAVSSVPHHMSLLQHKNDPSLPYHAQLTGHSRADIAEVCGVSPATVKKYWAAIYARLGVESRQMLRAWLQLQLAGAPVLQLQEQAASVGHGTSEARSQAGKRSTSG